MTERQTSQIVARVVYFMEILVFAAPFYLTYGLLAVISAPYAGLLILFSPVWLLAYLGDANGDAAPVLIIAVIVILAATLSVTGVIALWKLAKLSHIYLFKGATALSTHRRDFRIGFYCGLAPLIFTTTVMAAVAVSDGGWTSLPFAIIGGGTLLVPVTHLWIAMREPRDEPVLNSETPLIA
jgi:hypothetical protein